jgi:hypothetical protein
VMRCKDSQILKRAEVQARLKLPPDQQLTHPESGVVRALYDCPDLPLGPEGMRCRLVVATHPAGAAKSRIGVTRSGVAYSLFLTNLPQSAFTSADVVALYLHRGAFENALADEDQELDERLAGVVMRQAVKKHGKSWLNGCGTRLLELGHQLHPDTVRSTEFAPAAPPDSPHTAPLSGSAPPRWACPGKLAASLVKTFLFNRMTRSVVLLASRWLPMSGVEKPMAACVSCMRRASSVVVPVSCASSVSGRGAPPRSRAR